MISRFHLVLSQGKPFNNTVLSKCKVLIFYEQIFFDTLTKNLKNLTKRSRLELKLYNVHVFFFSILVQTKASASIKCQNVCWDAKKVKEREAE